MPLILWLSVLMFALGWGASSLWRLLQIARHQRCMMCDGHGYQTPGRLEAVLRQSQGFKP